MSAFGFHALSGRVIHSDKKRSVKYGRVVTDAHHEIRFSSALDGSTLLVKVFTPPYDAAMTNEVWITSAKVELSLNGTFGLRFEEMTMIRDEVDRFLRKTAAGTWEGE